MSDAENNDSGKGFKVRDRRGEEREVPAEPASKAEPAATTAEADSMQPITFVSFLLSLSTSTMMHLGLVENPLTKKKEEDLALACQEIHIIEMLKEKTSGNLNDEESRLIEDILFHVRMKYVEKTKA